MNWWGVKAVESGYTLEMWKVNLDESVLGVSEFSVEGLVAQQLLVTLLLYILSLKYGDCELS